MRSKTLSVDSSEKAKRKRSKNDLRENLRGWGILGPIILYYFIFGIVPMIILFRYSFLEDDLFKGTVFVGFDNFVKIFTNSDYYLLFFATILIAVFTIGLSLLLGMLIAVAVTQPIRARGAYRTVYYIPVVISMAVVAQIANVWLSYNEGTFNNILRALGMEAVAWKQSTFWMYFWIIFICVWKGLGATVILLVAGLNAVPPELYEAAELDGAGAATKFFKITLPQLRPMLVFVMITSIIGAFNIFEPVQLISNGGPDGTTKVILFQIYNEAFQNGNFGMGSAIAVVVLVLLMILTMLNMKFGEEKEEK